MYNYLDQRTDLYKKLISESDDENNNSIRHGIDGEWGLDNNSCYRWFPYNDNPRNISDNEEMMGGKPAAVFYAEISHLLKKCEEAINIESDDEYEEESDEEMIDLPKRSNLDICFTPDEIRKLESANFPSPSTISDDKKDLWIMKVEHALNKLGRTKGALTKTEEIGRANKNKISDNEEMMILLRLKRYIETRK